MIAPENAMQLDYMTSQWVNLFFTVGLRLGIDSDILVATIMNRFGYCPEGAAVNKVELEQ